MKSKKLISLLCAAAMTVSSFAGLTITASAETGDSLLTKVDFESVTLGTPSYSTPHYTLENGTAAETTVKAYQDADVSGTNWGAVLATRSNAAQGAGYYGTMADAAAYFEEVIGTQKVDASTVWDTYTAPTVATPANMGSVSLYFASQQGMANDQTLTITPAITNSSSDIYDINFDMMLTNGDFLTEGVNEASSYDLKFNDGTVNNSVHFVVAGPKLQYYDGSTIKDTAITDLTLAGKWFNFNLKVNTKTHMYIANIYPYDGDTLSSTAVATIEAAFESNASGKITKMTARPGGSGRGKGAINCAIDNFVVTEGAEVPTFPVTINYKSGGAAIDGKSAVTIQVEEGKNFTADGDYIKAFATEASEAEGKYYKYDATSNNALTNVTAAASIDLNFTQETMPTITFNATTGDSKTLIKKIGETKAVPGTKTAEIYAHEYIQDAEGNWYQKDDGKKGGNGNAYDLYALTVTAGETDVVETVNYKPAFNVVYFAEAEDVEGASTSESGVYYYSNNYPLAVASGGLRATIPLADGQTFPTGYSITGLDAGNYVVTVCIFDAEGKRGIPVSTVSDSDLAHAVKAGEIKGAGLITGSVPVELAENSWIYVGKCANATIEGIDAKINAPVDYIVVKDANVPAEPLANVTLTYTKNGKKASLTTDKDRTENVVLVHVSYDNGALSSIKAYPVAVESGTTPTEQVIAEDDILKAGDKLLVWNSLSGMAPLCDAHDVTAAEADGNDDPDPVTNYIVSVDPTIENGTVEVDKTSAPAGETVTITARPDDGYAVAAISVKNGEADVEVINNAFTMPAGNVKVTVTFAKPTYTITVDENITGGTVEADKTSATAGETVTLTVTADTNYSIDEVKYNGTAITADADGEYSFTMPAEAVTVTAAFSEIPELTGTVTISGDIKERVTVRANVTGAPEGAELKYQWMSAPAADGEYTATSRGETRRIADGSAGQYIKVVVTAEGYRGSIESAPEGPVEQATEPIVKYNITSSVEPAGTADVVIKVDGTEGSQAEEEVEVTVAAAAKEGYRISEVTVDDEDTEVTDHKDGTYTFKMPAKDVAVTVKTVAVYAVTKGTETNGTYKVSQTTAKAGDEISVTNIVAAEGYVIGAVKYNGTAITADENGAYKFTMPGAPVEVTVEFAKKQYAVTITAPDAAQGTLTVNKTGEGTPEVSTGDNLAWGDTFTVTAAPAEGYENPVVKVMNGAAEITANEGVYTMPKAGVTISVTFTKIQHTVTITSNENADITVKNGEAPVATGAKVDKGTTLTITASAKTGYTITAVKANGTELTVQDGVYTTTVNADVTITVDTTAIPTYTITKAAAVNGSFNVSAESAYANTTISITDITPADGYELDAVTVTDADNNPVTVENNSFTLPAKNVTVTVTFKFITEKTLTATAATWVKKDDTTAHNEDENLSIGSYDSNQANEITLLKYDVSSIDMARVADVKLHMSIASAGYDSNGKRWADTELKYGVMTSNDWEATATFADISDALPASMTSAGWTPTKTNENPKVNEHGPFYDFAPYVTDAVKAADGVISLALGTASVRNHLIANAPTLVVIYGQNVTFNVTESDGTTPVANAAIEVKSGDSVYRKLTTDENGAASAVMAAGEYTYTVTSTDYAIKKDGALTVASAAVTENATLAANVPTTVAITSPDNTVVTLTDTVTFTATIKDQDNREMANVPLTWSIVDSPEKIAVTDGTVSATEGVTEGNYTVQVAVTANADVNATASFSVVTAQPTKVTVKYNDGTADISTLEITENMFVGDKYTLPETYRTLQAVKGEDSLYTLYDYVSGGSNEVTLAANNNDIVITVAARTDKYIYYNNFEASDSVLFTDRGRGGSARVTEAANPTYVNEVTSTGKTGANSLEIIPDSTDTADKLITVSYDIKMPGRVIYFGINGDNGSNRTIAATDAKLFSMHNSDKQNLTVVGGTEEKFAYDNANPPWIHVEAVVNTKAKTTDITIYAYRLDGNYATATPIKTITALGFRNNTAAKVQSLQMASENSPVSMFVDNVMVKQIVAAPASE